MGRSFAFFQVLVNCGLLKRGKARGRKKQQTTTNKYNQKRGRWGE